MEEGLGLTVEAMRLPALAVSLNERFAGFSSARDSFAAAMGVQDVTGVRPPAALADDDAYAMALTVHMAALAALDAQIHAEVAPQDPSRLSEYLLRRELVHWQELHAYATELPTVDAWTMRRAVFIASLAGPLSHTQGATVIDRVGLATGAAAVEQIMDSHAHCYPPYDAATVLEPLSPDRLAEDFVALLTPGHTHANTTDAWEDAWTVSALPRLLAAKEDSDGHTPPFYFRQALTILIETASRWEHVATGQLYPLLRKHLRLALTAGCAALATLARLPHLDLSVLEALEPHFPDHHVDLDIGAAACVERLAEYRLACTSDPTE
ncbi:MAG: hypothetical protein M3460_23420 [Actinomycetota bacterium]|nr:hypothetical protein [Actinomycetota bacterium]